MNDSPATSPTAWADEMGDDDMVRSLTVTGRLLFGSVFLLQIVFGFGALVLAAATGWGGGAPAWVQNVLVYGGFALMGLAFVGLLASAVGHETSRGILIASTGTLLFCASLSVALFLELV